MRSGVIPAPPAADALRMMPRNLQALIKTNVSRNYVFALDMFARARSVVGNRDNADVLAAFGTKLLREIGEFEAGHTQDDVFSMYARLHSDAALFDAHRDLYDRPLCAETASIIAGIDVDAKTRVPLQRATLLLYDSVRSSKHKSHVLPLAKMSLLAGWPSVEANLQPCFANAAAVQQHPAFQRAVRYDAAATAHKLAEWVAAQSAVAHNNMLHVMGVLSRADNAKRAEYALTFKHVGVQLVLYRVGVVNTTDHSIGSVYKNVCYRVENVVVPFSANAVHSNRACGFAGTLYYQYERTHGGGGGGAKPRRVWGAIGGKKFWKQLSALFKEDAADQQQQQDADGRARRTFRICTTDGRSELAQMYMHVELLGVCAGRRGRSSDELATTTRLGRVMYAVAMSSFAAHNMGVLRALFGGMEHNDDHDAGGGDGDGGGGASGSLQTTTPLSQLLHYDDATFSLSLTSKATAAAARTRSKRPAGVKRPKCASNAVRSDSRGAIDNFDDTWFSTAVAADDDGRQRARCTAQSKTTSPVWMPIDEMRRIVAENAPSTDVEACVLRALVSEWNRRTYAVVNKCYVRCGPRWASEKSASWQARTPPARRPIEACDFDSPTFQSAQHVTTASAATAAMKKVMDSLQP